jgi:vesicle-fusing ATPase
VSVHKRARDALPPLLRAVAGGAASVAAAAGGSVSVGAGIGPEHLTVLVHGPPGVGKSAAVAAAASAGGDGAGLFPHVKVFRADVVAASGGDVAHALRTAFDDTAKATLSLLVIDGLEVLLGVAPGDVAPAPPVVGLHTLRIQLPHSLKAPGLQNP